MRINPQPDLTFDTKITEQEEHRIFYKEKLSRLNDLQLIMYGLRWIMGSIDTSTKDVQSHALMDELEGRTE